MPNDRIMETLRPYQEGITFLQEQLRAAGEREGKLREALKAFADEADWRDVNLEDDEESTYDACAWSPYGQPNHPHFHKPWMIAQLALASAPTQGEGIREAEDSPK